MSMNDRYAIRSLLLPVYEKICRVGVPKLLCQNHIKRFKMKTYSVYWFNLYIYLSNQIIVLFRYTYHLNLNKKKIKVFWSKLQVLINTRIRKRIKENNEL